ncbi:capsular polysaccharide synthesis protein [Thiomicrorhabdus indica]|uniref:capsular polysaccharide synthesis protein n=1 Tax=Thiomicrorhabdus indica TaxID=2267253 RepID=UPI002AA69250|nr:capsular polysaccharide synthesis protein [Thiomicrorhabdus indica]
MQRVIWQYWEKGEIEPLFVDELHQIAKKNSGVQVIQVTPNTLDQYLPNLPSEVLEIKELAHKADMIRTRLLYQYGGMWLDSDAIVLKDLNEFFDLLDSYEFISFNNNASFSDRPLKVRINAFLSRPGSQVLKDWIYEQNLKLPKKQFAWTEVGTDLLDPIVLRNQKTVKLLNFDLVCPVKWNEVERFSKEDSAAEQILNDSYVVMLSNKAAQMLNAKIVQMSLDDLAKEQTLLAAIIKAARRDRQKNCKSNRLHFLRKWFGFNKKIDKKR